jgi:glutamate synthase (ferredoxin)
MRTHPASPAKSQRIPSPSGAASPDPAYPLYDPRFEHDACGIGFVATTSGKREHCILAYALEALTNLAHRGAMDADAATSDGVGVMTQIPHRLLSAWLTEQGAPAVAEQHLAVGMIFLPPDEAAAERARAIVAEALARRGAQVLGSRAVPVDGAVLGEAARRACPRVEQVLALRPESASAEDFERTLFLARKECESRLSTAGEGDVYVVSLSARTVVYKGLLTAVNLARFYPDLRDPRYETALALFHQRYSTNTFPSWRLAQPMRLLAHNGEINTIDGNRGWMEAREAAGLTARWGEEAVWLRPIIQPGGSDSASLDNALELLLHCGRPLLDALTLLAPEAWESQSHLAPAVRAMCQLRASLMEPWDGPAALVFSDGNLACAALDRNGLRPLRYVVTADGLVVLGSEVGIVDLDMNAILTRGRLGPGQVFAVDTARGLVLDDRQIKHDLANAHPYVEWARAVVIPVEAPEADANDAAATAHPAPAGLLAEQTRFGMSHEDVELVLRPMAREGAEAVWSMGDDTPLAALSRQSRQLSSYFKQRFAQVTNPPIDFLRERLVTSLTTHLGPRGDALSPARPTSPLPRLGSPILDDAGLHAALDAAARHGLTVRRIATTYALPDARAADGEALRLALDALEAEAVAAVRAGGDILLLSDRGAPPGSVPLPMPLVLAAVHQALVRAGLRLRAGIVAETGAAWDGHQVALLLGYGANVVAPHLALRTVRSLAGSRGMESLTQAEVTQHYRQALEKGLLRIMARMGLTVLESYIGAQLFEYAGLSHELGERYFPGTPGTAGGLSLAELQRRGRDQWAEAERLAAQARSSEATGAVRLRLADRGHVRFRQTGEYHANHPQLVKALQRAVQSGAWDDYQRYAQLVTERPPNAIRDLLTWRPGSPIPLEEVEPAAAIVRRFVTSAMSLGALSPEAHLTLTLGANLVGARSNTGEGGEDPGWYTGARDGVSTNSRVKQVASGRFGVTPAYLAHAAELEIKMAQGSKPGEGGQLPARKVTDLIARLRHTEPGISLISPAPHHDIYSIEDLAQLIFDLKRVNPRAAVGVKLVAERGVGAVAAGVAKAHADYILISGHDGGTGASPLGSIKHAGGLWELGLAEAQQTLRRNGLRERVRLRTDGGLKVGRDVVMAAMLGADEFGLGTAALIAIGCDMARQCHLDTCPAGIATQREDLRQRFTGTPEHVATFLRFIAEDVRAILASIGARTLDEVIGRADLLQSRDGAAVAGAEPALDLAAILATGPDDVPRRHISGSSAREAAPTDEDQILTDALPLLERGHAVVVHRPIRNGDRAVGARLAGAIAHRWGDTGIPSGSMTCQYTGSAGQSFGAFCVPELRLILVGDANDYVAKGMTGGQIIVKPATSHTVRARDQVEQVIMGNTVLYGATGGLLLARGRAGERFAVRNSGAVAVVEGVGDHGCEYMTGGAVVVLGATGRNFGAGMSGGIAYVYDPGDRLPALLNDEMVCLARLDDDDEADDLFALVGYHAQASGSDVAAELLGAWPDAVPLFWRVAPHTATSSVRPLERMVERLRLTRFSVPTDSSALARRRRAMR